MGVLDILKEFLGLIFPFLNPKLTPEFLKEQKEKMDPRSYHKFLKRHYTKILATIFERREKGLKISKELIEMLKMIEKQI